MSAVGPFSAHRTALHTRTTPPLPDSRPGLRCGWPLSNLCGTALRNGACLPYPTAPWVFPLATTQYARCTLVLAITLGDWITR